MPAISITPRQWPPAPTAPSIWLLRLRVRADLLSKPIRETVRCCGKRSRWLPIVVPTSIQHSPGNSIPSTKALSWAKFFPGQEPISFVPSHSIASVFLSIHGFTLRPRQQALFLSEQFMERSSFLWFRRREALCPDTVSNLPWAKWQFRFST